MQQGWGRSSCPAEGHGHASACMACDAATELFPPSPLPCVNRRPSACLPGCGRVARLPLRWTSTPRCAARPPQASRRCTGTPMRTSCPRSLRPPSRRRVRRWRARCRCWPHPHACASARARVTARVSGRSELCGARAPRGHAPHMPVPTHYQGLQALQLRLRFRAHRLPRCATRCLGALRRRACPQRRALHRAAVAACPAAMRPRLRLRPLRHLLPRPPPRRRPRTP